MGFFSWLFGKKKSVSAPVRRAKDSATVSKVASTAVVEPEPDYFVVDTGTSHGTSATQHWPESMPQEVLLTFREQLKSVPALPTVWGEIQQAIGRGDSGKDIARIVRHDQGLATEILKAANSAGFGGEKKINDIGQAIVRLGFQAVRGIATHYCTANFSKQWLTPFSIQALWKHSMAVSALSSITAKYIPGCHAGVASTLGLLHDIGRLGLNSIRQTPFHYPPESDKGFLVYEYEHFGCTHIETGLLLAQHWDLPESLQQGIRFHHQPGLDDMSVIPESIRKEVLAVYLADYLAIHFGFSGGNKQLVEPHPSFASLMKSDLNTIAHDPLISKELWRIKVIEF